MPNWSAYQNAESKKLLPKRLGPFKVLEVDNLNYRLELPPMLKNHPIFHVSKLKLYHKPSHSHTPPRPPPVVIDSVEEFEVEKILKSRLFGRRKKKQFLVKWKGYPNCDATWENESNLKNAPEL